MLFGKSKEQKTREAISKEQYGMRWRCERAVENGSSPRAADLIASAYEKGKITETEAVGFYEGLQYTNDLDEIQRRFRVTEQPEERAKGNADADMGAIIGDILGSRFEGHAVKDAEKIWDNWEDTVKPTDDTILTIATKRVLQQGLKPKFFMRKMMLNDIIRTSAFPIKYNPFTAAYRNMTRMHPDAEYGGNFLMWAMENDDNPYGSLGNGSAMRVSPVGTHFAKQENVILYAAVSAMSTHNHIEGVKGAIVTAMCIWMAKNGYSREQIFSYMKKHYSYGEKIFTEFTYEMAQSIRYNQVECSYSVPAAVIAFYVSSSFTDALEKSIMVGLDTDTNACICGGIAGAYYGVDEYLKEKVKQLIADL